MTDIDDIRNLYINLLKDSLLGRHYQEEVLTPTSEDISQCNDILDKCRKKFAGNFSGSNRAPTSTIIDYSAMDIYYLLNYMKKNRQVHTMVSRSGLENVQDCMEIVIKNNIPGDFIEIGAWKGGLSILMRGILKVYGITERNVWVADSFKGLPKPNSEISMEDAVAYYLLKKVDFLSVSLSEVKYNFSKYNLLDQQVRFLKGWFEKTLPTSPVQNIAVMHLDGDWYDSTLTALKHLYAKISLGGFIIIDDYGLPLGCRKAVDDFRKEHKINEKISWVNKQSIFWRVSAPCPASLNPLPH